MAALRSQIAARVAANIKAVVRASRLPTDKLLRRLSGPFWVRLVQTEESLLATIQVLWGRSGEAGRILPALVVAARHHSPAVRLGAIEAIGLLGPGVVGGPPEVLLSSLRDSDSMVSAAAFRAVARFGKAAAGVQDRVKSALAEALNGSEVLAEAVIWASCALASMGDSSDGPVRAIAQFLCQDAMKAATKAVNALPEVDEMSAANFVQNNMFAGVSVIVDYEKELDGVVWHYPPSNARGVARIVAAQAIEGVVATKLGALRALAELGSLAASAEEAVRNLRRSPSKAIREQSEETLKAIGRLLSP